MKSLDGGGVGVGDIYFLGTDKETGSEKKRKKGHLSPTQGSDRKRRHLYWTQYRCLVNIPSQIQWPGKQNGEHRESESRWAKLRQEQ